MTRQDRIDAALNAFRNEASLVEIRDADKRNPNQAWRNAALGYVATAGMPEKIRVPRDKHPVASDSKKLHADTPVSHHAALKPSAAPNPAAKPDGSSISEKEALSLASQQNVRGQSIHVLMDGKSTEILSILERIRLCKEAAQESNLKKSGLDWKDIYAVVQAESGWVPRQGMGRNGKPSHGLAQMEDATARSLKINPHDTKESLVGVASLLKEAAAWAKAHGHSMKDGALSVYYNTSTAYRNNWNGSKDNLPIPTLNHIANHEQGKIIAAHLGRKVDQAHKADEKELLRMAQVMTPYVGRGGFASDGGSETQRMKGLIANELQMQKPAVVYQDSNSQKKLQQLAQDQDRAGIRLNTLGFAQFKENMLTLIAKAKDLADIESLPSSQKTTLDMNRRRELGLHSATTAEASEKQVFDLRTQMPGLVHLIGEKATNQIRSMANNDLYHANNAMKPAERDAAVSGLMKQEGATVYELRRLSERNLAFSGYFDKLAANQEKICQENEMRQRRG